MLLGVMLISSRDTTHTIMHSYIKNSLEHKDTYHIKYLLIVYVVLLTLSGTFLMRNSLSLGSKGGPSLNSGFPKSL